MSDNNTNLVIAGEVSSKDIKGRLEFEKQVKELLPEFYSVSGKLIALVYHGYRNRVDYFFDEDTIGAVSDFPGYLQESLGLPKSTAYAYTRISKTMVLLGDDNAQKLLHADISGHVTYLHKISRIRGQKKNKATILSLDMERVDALLKQQNKKAKQLYQTVRKIDGLKIKVDKRKLQFTVSIENDEDRDLALEQIEMLLEQHSDYENAIVPVDDYSVETVESEGSDDVLKLETSDGVSNVAEVDGLVNEADIFEDDEQLEDVDESDDLEKPDEESVDSDGFVEPDTSDNDQDADEPKGDTKLPESASAKSYPIPTGGKKKSMLKKSLSKSS
jgi:hypothetical protein